VDRVDQAALAPAEAFADDPDEEDDPDDDDPDDDDPDDDDADDDDPDDAALELALEPLSDAAPAVAGAGVDEPSDVDSDDFEPLPLRESVR
jgi:hypothetical protein